MPIGPKGQKRPKDVVANAVRVMQIATGQSAEEIRVSPEKNQAAVQLGSMGGIARASNLSKRKRSEIAKKAADARWHCE